MRMRTVVLLVAMAGGLPPGTAMAGTPAADGVRHVRATRGAYQGRGGPEQTERFSRTVKLAPDGSVSVSNISGDISVRAGTPGTVSIEAVKRTREDRSNLDAVQIEVDEGAGRVDVRTSRQRRDVRVSVDFTITVPPSAAVELHSVSGDVRVSTVGGPLRIEVVSGDVTTSGTPQLELAKSVSGNVRVGEVSNSGDVTLASVSGDVHARGLKARGLDVSSVSGDIDMSDASCSRLNARSVSGDITYAGALEKGARVDVNAHSGDVRLTLTGNTGFELEAATFSGSIRSALPLTISSDTARGRRGGNGRSIRATYGDGSALLTLRTFSGDIAIEK